MRGSALLAALGAAVAAGGLLAQAAVAQSPAPRATRPAWDVEPDLALGAKVYGERCASCHDKAADRTPSRAQLADMTPTFISTTLREGVMRPMAQGLGWPEVTGVAHYLSQWKGGGASTAALEAPLCKEKPEPMTLGAADWNGWGGENTHHRLHPASGLKASDVPRLKLKWAMAYAGGRNGQATVVGGRIFFNNSSGAVYSLDARTGCAYWRFDAGAATRASVVVGPLPDGLRPARFAAYFTDWTRSTYAIDAETGKLIWKTQVDDQTGVQMTGSPVLHEGILYVPVSSAEEAIATNDDYECCKFRGAVVGLDAISGRVLWKTYLSPEPKPFRKNAKGVQMYGPAGAAIWSAPTIDAKRGVLYVATGDSYTDVDLPMSDAVVALDLKTGAVRWHHQLTKADNYIIGCWGANPRANCPKTVGPDYDFGASPILHTLPNGKQLLLAGQKSSEVYALDPDARGGIVWKQRLSPGGALGGVEFSLAADGAAVYVPLSDVLDDKTGRPGLSALRITDGKLLWTTPSPKLPCHWDNRYCHGALSQAISMVPGVVFAGAMNGRFRAYDAKTGKVIWEYDTGQEVATVSGRRARGSVMDGAGPTIADGTVYVSTGYQARSGTPGQVLMAFSVDGK